MALTFRIYRSLVIGDGLSPATAKRSALTRYIKDDGESGFWDWTHEAREIRYSLARCDSTVHTLISADVDITAISGEFPDWQAWLDLPLSSVPLATRNLLESDGFPIGWATAQTTRREAFIYISRIHLMMQELRRLRDMDAMQLFTGGLDATVNTLSAQVRSRVSTWMVNHGLNSSWITGTTTIRQVIHFIVTNTNWPSLSFGPHGF